MKCLLLVVGLSAALISCGNKEEKAVQGDSSIVVNAAGDSTVVITPKPGLSVADSAQRLQEKDTAAKMIENAPASVSIHLDSIPEQQ